MHYELLNEILNKRNRYYLKNNRNLMCFLNGYYAAHKIYTHEEDEQINSYILFNNYIEIKFSIFNNNWGLILDFYHTGLDFASIFFNYYDKFNVDKLLEHHLFSNKQLLYLPIVEISKSNYIQITSFKTLIYYLKNNYGVFDIYNLRDFNSFFAGYLSRGDHKKENLYDNLKYDKTFIYFYLNESKFNEFLSQKCNFKSDIFYLTIVQFLTPFDEIEALLYFYDLILEFEESKTK